VRFESGRQSPNRDALYGREWKRRARAFLRRHPICAYCEEAGRLNAASVVDHKTPHKGDADLFWNEANWQPLCAPCHDSIKSREERTGMRVGCDVNGTPLDPRHPWRSETTGGHKILGNFSPDTVAVHFFC